MSDSVLTDKTSQIISEPAVQYLMYRPDPGVPFNPQLAVRIYFMNRMCGHCDVLCGPELAYNHWYQQIGRLAPQLKRPAPLSGDEAWDQPSHITNNLGLIRWGNIAVGYQYDRCEMGVTS